jgi:phosphate-selective porin OprO and OprP
MAGSSSSNVKQLLTCLCSAVFLLIAGGPDSWARSTTEEILELLREREQLTESEYERLKARAQEEEGAGEERSLSVFWDEELVLRSADEAFSITLGGRIQNDWGYVTADNRLQILENDNSLEGFGTQLRRIGLLLTGTMYQWWEFGIGIEFSDGIFVEDAWVGVRDVAGLGFVRIGHQKEPFSLEELTSDRFVTFTERGLPNVFVPSWNTGLHLGGTGFGERMTWAAGVFEDTDASGSSAPFDDVDCLNLTGRITGLPWRTGEARLAHLGLSYSRQFRDRDESELEYAVLPESNLPDVELVDTGEFVAGDVDLVGIEAALVLGRLSLQGEYVGAFVDRREENPRFHGYYAYVSYFLTGESRSYDPATGAFGRISPSRPFVPGTGGWGGWELAMRYSFVDLEDAGINGGEERNVTLALNWYPVPNIRAMLNYVYAEVDRRVEGVGLDSDSVQVVKIRFQAEL